MSYFQVNLETVLSVTKHPNADTLDLIQVEGKNFTFIYLIGKLQPGDKVFHFPVDSLIPEDILVLANLSGKLSGAAKNRVKTKELRGIMSQGVLITPSTFNGSPYQALLEEAYKKGTTDFTTLFGVTKYEPPEIPCHTANLVPLPEGVEKYDIEGAQNFPDILEALLNLAEPVYITEKLEGTNYAITYNPVKDEIVVSQRNNAIKPIDGAVHDFWKVTNKLGLVDTIRKIAAEDLPNQQFTLRGEIIGPNVQKNIYGLKELTLKLFDIRLLNSYLDSELFWTLAAKYSLPTVPLLSSKQTLKEWLNGRTLIEASSGPSALKATHLREGVVIKPGKEQRIQTLKGGYTRLILKQRDPIYLDKTGF